MSFTIQKKESDDGMKRNDLNRLIDNNVGFNSMPTLPTLKRIFAHLERAKIITEIRLKKNANVFVPTHLMPNALKNPALKPQ